VLLRHQDVGHEGAHDGPRQLLAGLDRDDPANRAPADGGEAFTDPGLGQAHQFPR
jgi:hypothetical protein